MGHKNGPKISKINEAEMSPIEILKIYNNVWWFALFYVVLQQYCIIFIALSCNKAVFHDLHCFVFYYSNISRFALLYVVLQQRFIICITLGFTTATFHNLHSFMLYYCSIYWLAFFCVELQQCFMIYTLCCNSNMLHGLR